MLEASHPGVASVEIDGEADVTGAKGRKGIVQTKWKRPGKNATSRKSARKTVVVVELLCEGWGMAESLAVGWCQDEVGQWTTFEDDQNVRDKIAGQGRIGTSTSAMHWTRPRFRVSVA
jgi:hypothetical protein